MIFNKLKVDKKLSFAVLMGLNVLKKFTILTLERYENFNGEKHADNTTEKGAGFYPCLHSQFF